MRWPRLSSIGFNGVRLMLNFKDLKTPDLTEGWLRLKETGRLANPNKHDRFYQSSYRFILPHFSTCIFDGSKPDCDRFWQALILVYSWMGRGVLTDFDNSFDRYRDACDMIKHARDTGEVDLNSLNVLIALCNGSTIATSKFLHFLKPEAFAIWDSRVCAAIFDGKAHHYSLKDPENLLAYFNWIRKTDLDPKTLKAVTDYLGINKDNGALRAKEFILFITGTDVSAR